jgi:hypothetical protein
MGPGRRVAASARAPASAGRRRAAGLAALALGALALGALASACASYSERTSAARSAAGAGDYRAALEQLNGALGVESADELPTDWRGDAPLALLERATLLQAMGEFGRSARDFEVADRELEVLDIAADPGGEIARYLYSESVAKYRTTPTEKLSLNALNLLNYLARGDLAGAAVEARRFTVMRQYLVEYDPDHAHGAFGSYLAGFVFEHLSEPDRALRYYEEALQEGHLETLREPVARIAPLAPYRGERLAGLLGEAPAPAEPPRARSRRSEILVVVGLGRVPLRVPQRMPVGAAVGLAGAWVTGDPEWLGYGALKVVVYPELAPSGSTLRGAALRVDGSAARLELASDLGQEIRREYEEMKPRILGAAVSRLIARAAVAEGARRAGQEAGDAGEAVGWIAALLTEGTLLALDQPDTRSWTLLPEVVLVSRASVAPGRHRVEVELEGAFGESRSFEVEAPAGGFAAVVWTVPR